MRIFKMPGDDVKPTEDELDKTFEKINKNPRTYSELLEWEASLFRWNPGAIYRAFVAACLRDLVKEGIISVRMEMVPASSGADRNFYEETRACDELENRGGLMNIIFARSNRAVYYETDYFDALIEVEAEG